VTFPRRLFWELKFDLLKQIGQQTGCMVISDRNLATIIITPKPRNSNVPKAVKMVSEFIKEKEKEDLTNAAQFHKAGWHLVSKYPDSSTVGAKIEKLGDIKIEYYSSYSWNYAEKSTILSVPGFCKHYTKPKLPLHLIVPKTIDHTKTNVIDLNKDSFKFSLEPLLVACHAYHSEFTLNGIDFVTDRNNLRKIFGWAIGDDKRWRIDFERVNNTIIALRFDLSDKNDVSIQNSEKAATFEDLCCIDKHEGHSYRAIFKLQLSNFKCLIRCEIDATKEPPLEESLSMLSLTNKTGHIEGSELKFIATPKSSKTPEFIELKSWTDNHFNGVMKTDVVNNFEAAELWFQSFFSGAEIVFGLKSSNLVNKIMEYSVQDVLKVARIDAIGAINKIVAVLSYVKQSIQGGGMYSLYFEPGKANPSGLCLMKWKDGDTSSMIPEYYKSGDIKITNT